MSSALICREFYFDGSALVNPMPLPMWPLKLLTGTSGASCEFYVSEMLRTSQIGFSGSGDSTTLDWLTDN